MAIGYTRVYLKEVVDEDGTSHAEPITNAERASQEISGSKEKRGNLTLYTTAFATKIGITVKSTAQWGTAFQLSQENTPAPYYDYLSAATTSTYYLMNSSSFSANLAVMNTPLPSKWYSKKKVGNASVTYSFMDCATNAFSVNKAVATINCSRVSGKTPPNTVKATSKYVHTWGSGEISISIGTSGPSFNLSNVQKSWQIMSDVNTPSS